MRRVILVLLLLSMATIPALADQPKSAKEEKVRELLRLTGAATLGTDMLDAMIGSMKASAPHVREEFWTAFRSEVNPNEIVELVVPIYMKHVEENDLDELLRFYRTPAAQRFVAKQSAVMTESMEVGQKWGAELARRALEKLQAESSKEETGSASE